MHPATAPTALTVYGIANCDTVKKARLWLQNQGLAAEFHDFKKQGLAPDLLAAWVQTLGWERLLNRKGTTWRKLAPAQQASACDAAGASALMLAHQSVIKRPVVRWPDGRLSVGFAPEAFAAMLA
jgi:Spx/MgsR family transcriptional regulator